MSNNKFLDGKGLHTVFSLINKLDNNIENRLSQSIEESAEAVKEDAEAKYQPKGSYATKTDLNTYATKTSLTSLQNTINELNEKLERLEWKIADANLVVEFVKGTPDESRYVTINDNNIMSTDDVLMTKIEEPITSFKTNNVVKAIKLLPSTEDVESLSITGADLITFNTESLVTTDKLTSFSFSNVGLETIKLKDFNTKNVTKLTSVFANAKCISIDLGEKFDTSSVTVINSMFNGCSNLETLNLGGNFDMTKVTSNTSFVNGCSKLYDVTGNVSGININLNLSYAKNLSHDGAMTFINGLAQVSAKRTITFSSYTYGLLSSSDISIATDKNWTVARGS